MTAKEQAEELINKYSEFVTTWNGYDDCPMDDKFVREDAAKCATIGVNQILSLSGLPQYQIVFWREVLEELKNS